jgi:hypothetical protein
MSFVELAPGEFKWLGGLYGTRFLEATLYGSLDAYYQALAMTTLPATADAMIGAGMVVLPIATWVGGIVAIFYAPWAAAEEAIKEENFQTGLSQGYVMGLLRWEWGQVRDRFARLYVLDVYQDNELNVTRVKAYNAGLVSGYATGNSLSDEAKHSQLKYFRNLAGHPSAGNWTRQDQISYVISLAGPVRLLNFPKTQS